MEGTGAGWSVRWLGTRGTAAEWDWKTFNKGSAADDDIVSAASGDSAPSLVDGRGSGSSQGKSTFNQPTPTGMRNPVQRPSKPPSSSTTLRSTSSAASRRGAVPENSSISITVPAAAHSSSSHTTPPISIGSSHYANSAQRPRPRISATPSSGDPHAHPTSTPPPASALSVYQIAHRYELPGLATLALEHMMTTITPQSCFALLLASVMWDDLHSLVEVSGESVSDSMFQHL